MKNLTTLRNISENTATKNESKANVSWIQDDFGRLTHCITALQPWFWMYNLCILEYTFHEGNELQWTLSDIGSHLILLYVGSSCCLKDGSLPCWDSFFELCTKWRIPFVRRASSLLMYLGSPTPTLPKECLVILGEIQVQLPGVPFQAVERFPSTLNLSQWNFTLRRTPSYFPRSICSCQIKSTSILLTIV